MITYRQKWFCLQGNLFPNEQIMNICETLFKATAHFVCVIKSKINICDALISAKSRQSW